MEVNRIQTIPDVFNGSHRMKHLLTVVHKFRKLSLKIPVTAATGKCNWFGSETYLIVFTELNNSAGTPIYAFSCSLQKKEER